MNDKHEFVIPNLQVITMKNEHKGHKGHKDAILTSNTPGLYLILDVKPRQRLIFASFVLPLCPLC